MNTAIVLLLLLGFSICVVVGLVTVLQSLVNQPSVQLEQQTAILPDRAAEQ